MHKKYEEGYMKLLHKTESIEGLKGMKCIAVPLVKAIQEQQTIIDDLKSRIETLEE